MISYLNVTFFDRYQAMQKLAETSVFASYLGVDTQTGDKVQIRILNPSMCSRYEVDKICFAKEVVTIRKFRHNNILKLITADIYANTVCAVFEYAEGYESLSDFIDRKGILPLSSALSIISQLAEALNYAHSENILHRGIKPTSIIIREQDGSYNVKLFNFGMSNVVDYMNSEMDDVNNYFGFSAPETTGLLEQKVDARSDLYSLGILLYRFLTGRLPFTSDSVDNMVYQHVAVTPIFPGRINHDIPEEISNLILKLITKEPGSRYSDAAELIQDIDRFLHEGTTEVSSNLGQLLVDIDVRFRRFCRSQELDKVLALSTEAINGSGNLCLIRGEWGSGKSDVFTNFCSAIQERDIKYFRAKFTSQNSMTPYSAFHDILDEFFDIFRDYDRKQALSERSRLAKTVLGCTELIGNICQEAFDLLPASQPLPQIDSYKVQQRIVSLLANFFLSLFPKESPYVLVFGDLHFADPASLALLAEMAAQLRSHNVFILVSYRDSAINTSLGIFLKNVHENAKYNDIFLAPFDKDRMRLFIAQLLNVTRDTCGEIAEYITEKTDGNPYFALNYIRSLLEEGVITIQSGNITQNWDALSKLNTSEDMTDIITKRMAGLSEDCIAFLEIASTVGTEVPLKLMSILTDLSLVEIDSLLEQAVTLQFVDYAPANIITFSHSDVHTVFSHRLSETRVKELHYYIAKAIEFDDSHPNKDIYRIVYHLNAAGADNELRPYIMEAAQQSAQSNATELAVSYYEKAVSLIAKYGDNDGTDWYTAKKALVELNLKACNFEATIEAAKTLLPSVEDALDQANLYRMCGLAYYRQGKFAQCEASLVHALDVLGETLPKSKRALSTGIRCYKIIRHTIQKNLLRTSGQHVHYDPQRSKLVVSVYDILSWVYLYTDYQKFEYIALKLHLYALRQLKVSSELVSAISIFSIYYAVSRNRKLYDQSLEFAKKVAKALNDQSSLAKINFYSALGEQWFGNLGDAHKFFKEATSSFTKIGDQWQLNNASLYYARNLQMLGKYGEAIEVCTNSIHTALKLGDTLSLCEAYTIMITAYTESGAFPQASDAVRKVSGYIEDLNLPYATAGFALAHGKLLLETKKYNDAVLTFENGYKILNKCNFLEEYIASIRGLLAIAKIKQLDEARTSLEVAVIQQREMDIYSLCNEAKKNTDHSINQGLTAYRAISLFGIMTERYRLPDTNYRLGTQLASQSKYTYQVAKLYYEYACYLLSQHQLSLARFYIFEAYMSFTNISSSHYAKLCSDIISERYRDDFQSNDLIADVSARKSRLNVDRRVNTLLRLGERLTSTLEVEELQKKILQDAVELVGAERGILFLYPETGDKKLYVASVYNLGSFDLNTYDWMLDEVERTRKPIVINDVQSDAFRKHYAIMVRYGIKSVMAMPMFVRGDLFGVIYLDSRLVRQIFSEEYIETMGFIANQGGAPIANARLYHRAITDSLTDLFGRSYLDNKVADLTSQPDVRLSAIMIDIDYFKKFNDTYGHPFGDKVLQQLARIMKRVVGTSGICCRYGGEEFVILLHSNTPEFILQIAEKLRANVEATTVPYTNDDEVKMVSVTISLGISIWDPSSMERLDLIEHADKALYYAKNHGKNRADLWSESM